MRTKHAWAGVLDDGGGSDGQARGREALPAECGPGAWSRIWTGCARRLMSWPVPPNWSRRDWLEEMRAEGAMASQLAVRAFVPGRNVPLGAYIRMRVMGQLLTRYRQEWAYGKHHVPADPLPPDLAAAAPGGPEPGDDALALALGSLGDRDRQIIRDLYWLGRTEAQVAEAMGISQQAVSKRKSRILDILFLRIKTLELE
ncbi:Sigma-70, region 4 [Aquisphaera giovannonii]|uniref:Sigma-70, region 4 n=1 Tax=Aquisphaera giovannonii TaxID=406548 RepID=A0A5B9WEH2_9BACT|nr:sigma-70 family RNA polymerase sigma factor [Aquisphaera giovannonii]QEH39056.1 Sigma-70, region 4 [Aquisphaera giovannonii]